MNLNLIQIREKTTRCVTLMFDSLVEKYVTLQSKIAACHYRLLLIEKQYNLSPSELEIALEKEELALTDQEVWTWHEELKTLSRLKEDLQILTVFLRQAKASPGNRWINA